MSDSKISPINIVTGEHLEVHEDYDEKIGKLPSER